MSFIYVFYFSHRIVSRADKRDNALPWLDAQNESEWSSINGMYEGKKISKSRRPILQQNKQEVNHKLNMSI